MENEVVKFLSKYIQLTEDEIKNILELSLIQKFKKGTVLLVEGEVAKNCYLVLQGCVRSYYVVDGEEKITEFYTEGQPITPVSYTTKAPSKYYISCIEDCILSVGSAESSVKALQKIPRIETIIGIIGSELLAESQMSFHNFRNLNPEQRLIELQEKRPDLCQRIPQYMLASYLGIKPESLSRIRKRLKDSHS